MMLNGRSAIRFLGPWFAGFTVLIALPLVGLLALSMLETDGMHLSEARFAGAKHYRTALGLNDAGMGDVRFRHAVMNSLIYTVIAAPLGVAAALATALLLWRPFRGVSVVRAIVYLPHLLGGAATIIIWSWLLNPRFGWINECIRSGYAVLDPVARWFGVEGVRHWPAPQWLYSPAGCKPAVILMSTWSMGGAMLIFLAALRRVPTDQYEAATLDGASGLARFRHVVWPFLTPVVLFNLVVSTVFCMQTFSEAYLLQNRRQEDGLLFFTLYLYEVTFEPPYRMGYAAALSCLFVVLLAGMVGLVIVSGRWWVFYRGAGRS